MYFKAASFRNLIVIDLDFSDYNPDNHWNIAVETLYRSYPKYFDRQAWANSVDPDQTPHNMVSDKGLHWLPTSSNY